MTNIHSYRFHLEVQLLLPSVVGAVLLAVPLLQKKRKRRRRKKRRFVQSYPVQRSIVLI